MAGGLTQEEIDALMSMGLGSTTQEEEEEEEPSPPPKAFAQSSFAQSSYTQSAPPSEAPAADAWASAQFTTQKRPPRKMQRSSKIENPVNVQIASFQPFEDEETTGDTTNLEIILNLDLEIRVELGKTTTTVRDVLEMGPGSVLELKKLNGEPVDLLVNQKHFSKGEMIVIGENFGVRVTDILSVTEIIEALGGR
jgi:flagellar motor switch protein FliN